MDSPLFVIFVAIGAIVVASINWVHEQKKKERKKVKVDLMKQVCKRANEYLDLRKKGKSPSDLLKEVIALSNAVSTVSNFKV